MGLTKRILRAVSFILPCVASADILTDSSTNWIALQGTSSTYWDYAGDEPTGNRQLDILGSTTSGSLYQSYSSDSLSGGSLSFRVRLAGTWATAFSGTALVGIDGDQNGSLDLFVGVNSASGTSTIRVWDVDPYRSNTGPTSTSIGSTLYEVTGASNTNYSAVNVIDGNGASFDLDGDGQADRYLSFTLSFEMLTDVFRSQGITIDANSPLRYAVMTAQGSNISDMGGLYYGSCGGTWSSCNGLTRAYSANYQPPPPPPPIAPIILSAESTGENPEPSTWMLLLTGLIALMWRSRSTLLRRRVKS
jgi:hypothetical protein